jgi:hypothetical protein
MCCDVFPLHVMLLMLWCKDDKFLSMLNVLFIYDAIDPDYFRHKMRAEI